jgi:hypothetical protein
MLLSTSWKRGEVKSYTRITHYTPQIKILLGTAFVPNPRFG